MFLLSAVTADRKQKKQNTQQDQERQTKMKAKRETENDRFERNGPVKEDVQTSNRTKVKELNGNTLKQNGQQSQ
jgi:hypothetical protein